MKITFEVSEPFEDIMMEAKMEMGLAATTAISVGSKRLQTTLRNQVKGAGLGSKLANSIRLSMYPPKGFSYSPAAEVYTNADKIFDGYNSGSLIRSKAGLWLAIPTKEAGVGNRGKKITPQQWKARTGRELRLVVNRHHDVAFLVADDLMVNKRGVAKPKGGRRRRDGILSGAQTIRIVILVPQVKLPKRLNFEAAVDQANEQLAGLMRAGWVD